LRHIRDSRAQRRAKPRIRRIISENFNAAGLDLAHPGDQSQDCRFTGSIGTYETNQPAGRDAQRESLHGGRFSVTMSNVVKSCDRIFFRIH
jgi:hypothetical protein